MLTAENQKIINKHLRGRRHPLRIFEEELAKQIRPVDVVLEIGCGREALLLSKLKGRAQKLIGLDLEPFSITDSDLQLINCSVSAMSIVPAASENFAYAQGVMEHVEDLNETYAK